MYSVLLQSCYLYNTVELTIVKMLDNTQRLQEDIIRKQWSTLNDCKYTLEKTEETFKNGQVNKNEAICIIAILFIFPLMFKTDIFHIMWAHDMIPIIANR